MSHGSNTSNHHPLNPRDDRETLSALFDGELPGDATRFALKRLDHDMDWRDTCGRWQLIGDALRGEATAAAPADFATSVMRKLAAEGLAAVVASPLATAVDAAPAVVATRRRWFGGAALAASVAVAAMLVARPFSQSSSTDIPIQAASGVVAPAPERTTPSGKEIVPAAASTASSSPVATLAVADAPPAKPRPATRHASVRPVRSSTDDVAMVVAAMEPATAQKPFHPPTGEIATRPWPRAVLPDADAGTLSVGFGAASTPTSSLYPFEPRLPDAVTQPAVTEPQH